MFPSVHGCIGKTSAGGAAIDGDEAFVVALLDEQGVAAVFTPKDFDMTTVMAKVVEVVRAAYLPA